MARTIKIAREKHHVSFQIDDGNYETWFGLPDILSASNTRINLEKGWHKYEFRESETFIINGAPFTGTAKEIVAKLRDAVFVLDPYIIVTPNQ